MAAALGARVIWIGVVDAKTYSAVGLSQRQREISLHELRGTIYDRNSEALVLSVPTKLVAVDPTLITKSDAVADVISSTLDLDRTEVLNALEKPDTNYSVVGRQVDAQTTDLLIQRLRDADLNLGVSVSGDPSRVAMNGDLARSVTGSMDHWGTEAISGIEKLYDDELSPTDGEELVEHGRRGSTIPGSERLLKPAVAGSDVVLTLDRALQYLSEAELLRQVEAVNAVGGTVVLGRPQTGEILAMASVTRNDQGEAVQGSLNQALRSYEPGSIMKLVTIAGAYDAGVVKPDSTFSVPDSIDLYDKTINDAHKHPTETMTVGEIFSQSSNVGTIKIAQALNEKVGGKGFVDYFKKFGLGSLTGIDLLKEQSGEVKPAETWNGTDIGSIPIGQSITATPLQMWAAYNVIANDGIYSQPRIVSRFVDGRGTESIPEVAEPRRVISAKTASMVTHSLEDVIEEGTGNAFKIPGFNIAAKSGTAYKVQNGTYGTRETRKYAASFVGFFPASDPQISIMVMIDEPEFGQHFGAVAAGPVFDLLSKETMRRFSIPSDAASLEVNLEAIRAQPATRPVSSVPENPAAPVNSGSGTEGNDSAISKSDGSDDG